jgi:AmmeMemoRadiSam system protein B
LLSPHIDYLRGGEVYAQVWSQAADAICQADLIVLFGTDHYGSDLFTLTRQNYATPYGILPTEQDIVDELANVLGPELAYAGELRHRGEHSLELVAVWLHHIRKRQPCAVVPILCGSFGRFVQNGASPADDPAVGQVLHTLGHATAGRRVAVIASGDLAHVGPAFGGNPLTDEARAAVFAADEDLIQQMQRGNADGFFESIRRVRDRNNVCGVSPIYLTLRLLGETQGQRAGYASCPADDQDTSAVSVCGMIFH